MVDLKFYSVDDSGKKTELSGIANFGNIYKANQSTIALAIYNAGDTTAYDPVLSLKQYGDFVSPVKWKSLAFDINSSEWGNTLKLDDIEPQSWLRGYDISSEDWSSYSTTAGTSPDDSWTLWQSSKGYWNVYNGYLQHYPDTQDGRARWGKFSSAADFTFSMKISVRANTYAGVLIRDTGDYDTGYIILVQGIQDYFTDQSLTVGEGVIQVYSGKFSSGYHNWKLLYESPSIGIRGTHDPFKFSIKDNKFQFWYGKIDGNPLCEWVDENNTYTNASIPVIVTHAGYGTSINYFDDLVMTVENENGRVYLKSEIPENTNLYGIQYSLLDISYGGEE